jgi:hypothetical protein
VTAIEEALYHATLPEHGEAHIGHLGPLVRKRTREQGYLVLTSRRLIFVRSPSPLRRSYDPEFEVRLEAVRKLSVVEGRLTSTFTANGETFGVPHLARPLRPSVVTAFRDLVAETRTRHLAVPRAAPPSTSRPGPVEREREVIRETVKIPCRYCGALVAVTDVRCPTCSAPLRP